MITCDTVKQRTIFNETEWEFLAAIDALEYLNFDTTMESVRDDAAEIATLIAKRSNANSQLIAELAGAIESDAADKAYAAGLGVSEWRAFLSPKAAAALVSLTPAPTEFPVEHVKLNAER